MKLLFVTSCSPAEARGFEKNVKRIYFDGPNKRPCLTFMHDDATPKTIREKAKEKKPVAVIFEEKVPALRITSTMTEVKKIMNGSSRFIHVSPEQIITGTEAIKDHGEVKKTLFV
ncbi:MAG TPA: hypothetical protein VG982_01930 [Candidatus Paceibacterota bacterium]|nr:hypothetical protein [Candidatus Paceibacterota bacterium]